MWRRRVKFQPVSKKQLLFSRPRHFKFNYCRAASAITYCDELNGSINCLNPKSVPGIDLILLHTNSKSRNRITLQSPIEWYFGSQIYLQISSQQKRSDCSRIKPINQTASQYNRWGKTCCQGGVTWERPNREWLVKSNDTANEKKSEAKHLVLSHHHITSHRRPATYKGTNDEKCVSRLFFDLASQKLRY